MIPKKYSAFPAIDFRAVWRSVKENNPLLDRENFFLYASGRSALHHGVSCLPLARRKKILVPFYHCGVEVEAILRAGLEVGFYPLKDNLEIDCVWLENNLTQDVGAILIIHFFGFPQPLTEIRSFCQRKNLFVIEDCAHALYSSDVSGLLGESGDIAIYSIMKTIGLPNGGGLLINNKQFTLPKKGRTYFNIALVKKTVRSILEFEASSNHATRRIAAHFLHFFDNKQAPTSKVDDSGEKNKLWYYEVPQYHYCHAISFFSNLFLKPLSVAKIINQRRENYKILLEQIAWNQEMQPIFNQIAGGVCPLCFPVRVKDSDRWNEELGRSGIFPFIFGRFSHPAFNFESFPQIKGYQQGIIGLPVHQQLDGDDATEIAHRINLILNRKKIRKI
jgi:dTDP-4-amino-4,6-dideoxygalactose transaminase